MSDDVGITGQAAITLGRLTDHGCLAFPPCMLSTPNLAPSLNNNAYDNISQVYYDFVTVFRNIQDTANRSSVQWRDATKMEVRVLSQGRSSEIEKTMQPH